MKITFNSPSASGYFAFSDNLVNFFLWLAQNRDDARVEGIIVLLASHDLEKDTDEQANIRRTINEMLENKI